MKDIQHSTYSTTNSTAVLTADSIRKAVEMLKEVSNQPIITSIKSKEKWWELLEKSKEVTDFQIFMGIPVIEDANIPEGIARFEYSDGTHTDINITNKIRYSCQN